MYQFNYKKRVRYAETDKMGYLYYGHYAKYYEIGRVEAIRSLGTSYASMEDDMGIMLPVLSLESRYIKPAFYDEEIEIQSILNEMPDKMITFHHKLLNSNQEIINKATVKLFFVDMQSGKRVSAPNILTDQLKKYF